MLNEARMGPWGWPRRGWILAGTWTAIVLLLAAANFALHGMGNETFGRVARLGARSGFIAFFLAFGAGPLHLLWPGRWTSWLVAHRPYLGVSFATSHFIFLGANVSRVVVHMGGEPFALRPPVAWLVGGIGFVMIFAMAATSFPGPARWLGARRWKALHLVGGYGLLLGFLNSFGTRALEKPEYLPFAAATLALLGLRLAACCKRLTLGGPVPAADPSSTRSATGAGPRR